LTSPLDRLNAGTVTDADWLLLPLTVTAAQAAACVGVGLDQWYRLVRENRCPLTVLRVGRSVRHRRSDLRALVLGNVAA